MSTTFKPAVTPPVSPDGDALAFAFHDRRLLVCLDETELDGEGPARVPCLADVEPFGPVRRQYLGTLDGRPVVSVELPALSPEALSPESSDPPAGMALHGLRRLYGLLDPERFALAGLAVQIVDWDRDHQFCGRCATPLVASAEERVKKCPGCGLSAYPRLAPAVIVLVEHNGECLLGRSPHFPAGMYSTLAGFVEPGETLEQCVVREVEEEAGVRVGDIRYFGSQPWPFPHSLMVGFRARYLSGDVVVDGEEIEDAAWFKPDAMPLIPPKISIARALIDDFLARNP